MATTRQTQRLKRAFLDEFEKHGNISEAARTIGIDRTNVYLWKQSDPEFLKEFEDAEIVATEYLETEARRRAADGVEEPVFGSLGGGSGTGQIGTIRKYSDTLLIFLLKGRAPEKYRDVRDVRHSGEVAQTLRIVLDSDDDDDE